MKKKNSKFIANLAEKLIRPKRKFPVKNTILLIFIVAIQVGLILLSVCYPATPKDVIHQYNVTVEPLVDGSLDIEYHLIWEALDETEELTWVEIGMANKNFSVYSDSVTSNIKDYSKYTDGGYVSLRLDFEKAYLAGDVIDFSFKVNQKNMLCKNEKGYFYEFVPGWFNSIKVEQYKFVWLMNGADDIVQQGSLNYGEYKKMNVQYGMNDFAGCKTVEYFPFDNRGAFNELEEDKIAITIVCCLFAGLLVIAEVNIVDSYVSYVLGRGFLSGYGYHVHVYGRRNPHYILAKNVHNSNRTKRAGGRSGGGCACACACACAGGGRAGCSQKDTYGTSKSWRKNSHRK